MLLYCIIRNVFQRASAYVVKREIQYVRIGLRSALGRVGKGGKYWYNRSRRRDMFCMLWVIGFGRSCNVIGYHDMQASWTHKSSPAGRAVMDLYLISEFKQVERQVWIFTLEVCYVFHHEPCPPHASPAQTKPHIANVKREICCTPSASSEVYSTLRTRPGSLSILIADRMTPFQFRVCIHVQQSTLLRRLPIGLQATTSWGMTFCSP